MNPVFPGFCPTISHLWHVFLLVHASILPLYEVCPFKTQTSMVFHKFLSFIALSNTAFLKPFFCIYGNYSPIHLLQLSNLLLFFMSLAFHVPYKYYILQTFFSHYMSCISANTNQSFNFQFKFQPNINIIQLYKRAKPSLYTT